MPPEVHSWNGEQAMLGRWRDLDGVGVIATKPGDRPPSPSFLEHCCSILRTAGYKVVVTPALTQAEMQPYLGGGFQVREQLHVLVHDLTTPPLTVRSAGAVEGVDLRRARQIDVERTLVVDRLAFDQFWRFDGDALEEACAATPQTRYRVAVVDQDRSGAWRDAGFAPGDVVGYCITGRSRMQGFLQRLAVVPAAQGRGVGRQLVWDAIHWLGRRRARSCVVNTQESNERARRLYEACGFRLAPTGLHVLVRDLALERGAVV